MRCWKMMLPILISMTVFGAPMAAYAVTVQFFPGRSAEPGANLFEAPSRTDTDGNIAGSFGSCLTVNVRPNSTASAVAQTNSGVNLVRVNARITNTCATQQVGLMRVFHTFASTSFGAARGYSVTVSGGIVPGGSATDLTSIVGNKIEKRSWVTYPLNISPNRVIAGVTRSQVTEAIGSTVGPNGANFLVKYECLLAGCALNFGPNTPGTASETAFTCSALKTAWGSPTTCPSTGNETIEDHYIVRVNAGDSIDFTNNDGASGTAGGITAYNTSWIVSHDLQPLGSVELKKEVLSLTGGTGDSGNFLVAILAAIEDVGGEDGGNVQTVTFNPRPCAGLTVIQDCIPYGPGNPTAGPGNADLTVQNIRDVNKDGLLDVVLQGQNPATGYKCGDTTFSVQGFAFFGQTLLPFQTNQPMVVTPCN